MARTLTGTTAATQKDLAGYQIVWIVEIDADEPDVGTTTLRYASRKITLSGNVYADALAENGITLPWHRFRPWGGIAQIGAAQVTFRNEAGESAIADTYALDNDALHIGIVFVTGAETAADIIWLWRGVVEDDPRDIREFELSAIDATDKRLKAIPSKVFTPADYPNAEFSLYGLGLPLFMGRKFQNNPFAVTNRKPALIRSFCTDVFQQFYMFAFHEITDALHGSDNPELFQYYEDSRRFGSAYNYIYQTPDRYFWFLDANPDRKMYLSPVLPLDTNTVTDWYKAADQYSGDYVRLENGDELDLRMGGVRKLGQLATVAENPSIYGAFIYVHVRAGATGSATITVTENGVTHATLNAYSFNSTIEVELDGDYSANWNFEKVNLYIAGPVSGYLEIDYVWIRLWYKDQNSIQVYSALDVCANGRGFVDDTANYNPNGTSNPYITVQNALIEYPHHVLEALIRSTIGLDEPYDQIDKPSFSSVAPFANVVCGFQLSEQRDIALWNEFGEAFGIHLYRSSADKWRMIGLSYNAADYAPVATFTPTIGIAIKNPDSPPSEHEPDARIWRLPSREIVNDVIVRHEKDYLTGDFIEACAATCHYRVTGTLDTLTPTGTGDTATVVDAAADFVTDGVAVGYIFYAVGLRNLTVTAVTDLHTLQVEDEDGGDLWARATLEYWVGPYTDGKMIRSWRRYKTINSWGDPVTLRNQGGKEVEFIGHLTAAQQDYYLDFFRFWRAERLYCCEFATHLNAIHVEIGDVIYFDHTRLPTWKRPYTVGTVSEDIDLTETVWTTPEAGLVDPWSDVDDYLLIDNEVVKVASTSWALGEMTVVRAQAGTVAATHLSGTAFKRLTHLRWMVWGVQIDVAKAQIRIEAREMPVADALLPGRIRANGGDTWGMVGIEEQLQGGFLSNANGQVIEENWYTGTNYISQGVGL